MVAGEEEDVKEEYRRIQPSQTPILLRATDLNATNPEKIRDDIKEKNKSPSPKGAIDHHQTPHEH